MTGTDLAGPTQPPPHGRVVARWYTPVMADADAAKRHRADGRTYTVEADDATDSWVVTQLPDGAEPVPVDEAVHLIRRALAGDRAHPGALTVVLDEEWHTTPSPQTSDVLHRLLREGRSLADAPRVRGPWAILQVPADLPAPDTEGGPA